MSDTTPNQGAGQDEDTSGHAAAFTMSISDPGEIGVETGQGKRPSPGDMDDTEGHAAAFYATDDGTEDDTEGPRSTHI